MPPLIDPKPTISSDPTQDIDDIVKPILEIFRSHQEIGTLVVKKRGPAENRYDVTFTPDGILYKCVKDQKVRSITYAFSSKRIEINKVPQSPNFLKEFVQNLYQHGR